MWSPSCGGFHDPYAETMQLSCPHCDHSLTPLTCGLSLWGMRTLASKTLWRGNFSMEVSQGSTLSVLMLSIIIGGFLKTDIVLVWFGCMFWWIYFSISHFNKFLWLKFKYLWANNETVSKGRAWVYFRGLWVWTVENNKFFLFQNQNSVDRINRE